MFNTPDTGFGYSLKLLTLSELTPVDETEAPILSTRTVAPLVLAASGKSGKNTNLGYVNPIPARKIKCK